MSLSKVSAAVHNWVVCREGTISSLRGSARELRASHQGNATAEHGFASCSLAGGLVNLGGILLTPVSGGASLVVLGLCGVSSSAAGIVSYLITQDANKKDESVTRKVGRDVLQALKKCEKATIKLKVVLQHFSDLEYGIEAMQKGDIPISLQTTSMSRLNISARKNETNRRSCQLRNSDSPFSKPGLVISAQIANLKAAMTSAEKVMEIPRVTKEVYRGTRTIREVVSTAGSVNQISQTAKSLSTAKDATVMSLQASQSVAKSTTAFASISRGADRVIKTAGVVSSAFKSGRVAAEVVTASGQTASAAKTVTKAVNAGTAISRATKGADTTIKTLKRIKQASNTVKVVTDTDKAIRTSRITTSAARVTKVSEMATKAASISKIGLVLNAVVIPFDIYKLVVAQDNLTKSHEDVELIETIANFLEQEMINPEWIYEYLQIMEKKLDFFLEDTVNFL